MYDKEDYNTAFKYLQIGLQGDTLESYRLLGYYYSEGYACTANPEKALMYFKKGISLGCPNCLGAIGEAYFEGKIVPKNTKKAEKILLHAIKKGSIYAKYYYTCEFHDAKERIFQNFSQISKIITNNIRNNSTQRKINRNAPCPCNSGKKYKKCCYQKSN